MKMDNTPVSNKVKEQHILLSSFNTEIIQSCTSDCTKVGRPYKLVIDELAEDFQNPSN